MISLHSGIKWVITLVFTCMQVFFDLEIYLNNLVNQHIYFSLGASFRFRLKTVINTINQS